MLTLLNNKKAPTALNAGFNILTQEIFLLEQLSIVRGCEEIHQDAQDAHDDLQNIEVDIQDTLVLLDLIMTEEELQQYQVEQAAKVVLSKALKLCRMIRHHEKMPEIDGGSEDNEESSSPPQQSQGRTPIQEDNSHTPGNEFQTESTHKIAKLWPPEKDPLIWEDDTDSPVTGHYANLHGHQSKLEAFRWELNMSKEKLILALQTVQVGLTRSETEGDIIVNIDIVNHLDERVKDCSGSGGLHLAKLLQRRAWKDNEGRWHLQKHDLAELQQPPSLHHYDSTPPSSAVSLASVLHKSLQQVAEEGSAECQVDDLGSNSLNNDVAHSGAPVSSIQHKEDASESRRFACPFYKRWPMEHIGCIQHHQLTPRQVKRHLLRYHLQPIHCPICYQPFDNLSSLDGHILDRQCDSFERGNPFDDRITRDQESELGAIRHGDGEERWFRMWDVLFPGIPQPDSPFVDAEDAGLAIFRHKENALRNCLDELQHSGTLDATQVGKIAEAFHSSWASVDDAHTISGGDAYQKMEVQQDSFGNASERPISSNLEPPMHGLEEFSYSQSTRELALSNSPKPNTSGHKPDEILVLSTLHSSDHEDGEFHEERTNDQVETQKYDEVADSEDGDDQSEQLSNENGTVISRLFSEENLSTAPSSFEGFRIYTEGNSRTVSQKPESFYNHLEKELSNPDHIDDIASLLSDTEDIQSRDGSTSVSGEIGKAAVDYLANILSQDSDLSPLYETSVGRLDFDRFVRNHTRLLKTYYLSLRSQVQNRKQKESVEILRSRVHRRLISVKIGQFKTKRERISAVLPQEDEQKLTLQRFLNNLDGQSIHPSSCCMEMPLDCDSSDDDEAQNTAISINLTDLQTMETFFVSGVPLQNFKADFRSFLYPTSKPEGGAQAEISALQAERHRMLSLGTRIWASLFDACHPPKPGYDRVRYVCGCGKDMFLDLKELRSGGRQRLLQSLVKDIASAVAHYQGTGTAAAASGLCAPPPAHLRTERHESASSSQSSGFRSSSSISRSSTPESVSTWPDAEGFDDHEDIPLQYLLMCINQKRLPVLRDIECSAFLNDQYLFREVLRTYQTAREESHWKISFLLPSSLSRWMERFERGFSTYACCIVRFFQNLGEISLYKLYTGTFVQFELVPMREACVPMYFVPGLPPADEVEYGRYSYSMKAFRHADIEIYSIPLWHLTQPGPHSNDFWLKRFPKKLRYPLLVSGSDETAIGWGIRLNERLDLSHFLYVILLTCIAITAIVIIYAIAASDAASAFGLGAVIAALVAIWIPYQYFCWLEKV